jgi:hypothetical protein
VDSGHKDRDQVIGIAECVKGTDKKGEQNFTLTWHKDIRVKGKTLCLDVSDPNDKADIILYPCHGSQGNQYWRYDVVGIDLLAEKKSEKLFGRKNNGFCTEVIPGVWTATRVKKDFM